MATLGGNGRDVSNNVGAHGEDGAFGNQGTVDAVDGGGDRGDGGCSATELTNKSANGAICMVVLVRIGGGQEVMALSMSGMTVLRLFSLWWGGVLMCFAWCKNFGKGT